MAAAISLYLDENLSPRIIVFGHQEEHTIGSWVRALELLCFVYSREEMRNHVEYL